MANNKIEAPPAPVEWDLPEPHSDRGTPDKSFIDDDVAAKLKARETAQSKAVQDRFVGEQPRRIVESQQRIEQAAPFLSAREEDAETHRAKQKAGVGKARPRETPQKKGEAAAPMRSGALRQEPLPEDAAQLEARLEKLCDRLCEMELQGRASAAYVNLPPEDQQKRVLAQALQRQQLELQFRLAMMQLLTSGVTFVLLADPRLTFKRLLRRFRRWPRRLPPGYRPRTAADFDAFLAWVFAPPSMPEGLTDDPTEPSKL